MNDKETCALFVSVIGPQARLQAGLASVQFARNFQSRSQGVANGPIVYFHKLFDKLHGSPRRRDVLNVDGQFDHSQIQVVESTWQFDAWVPQDLRDVTGLTESDVMNIVSGIIQTDDAIRSFREAKVGIQRVTHVRNAYIQDDRGRNEAVPSFDIVLTHSRQLVSAVPVVTTYDASIHRI